MAQEDIKQYPSIQGSFVNGIDQICRFVRQRLETVDAWVNALSSQETPLEPEQPAAMVNLVPTSTDTDGSIYNGVGYKENVRLSSSGGMSSSSQNGSVTTGFMPYTALGIIRIKGATLPISSAEHYYVHFYDANKNFLYGADDNTIHSGSGASSYIKHEYDEASGVTTLDFACARGAGPGIRPA